LGASMLSPHFVGYKGKGKFSVVSCQLPVWPAFGFVLDPDVLPRRVEDPLWSAVATLAEPAVAG
jgi:hypothetical protein